MVEEYVQGYKWSGRTHGVSKKEMGILEKVLHTRANGDREHAIQNVRSNTVLLVGGVAYGNEMLLETGGSGLLLTTNGFLVSAYHCVQRYFDMLDGKLSEDIIDKLRQSPRRKELAIYLQMMTRDGKDIPINLDFIIAEERSDMVLLKADMNKASPKTTGVRLYDEDVIVGTEVQLFGYPKGSFRQRRGKVTQKSCLAGYIDVGPENCYELKSRFETDIQSKPGFSGGPLINVQNGEVVGMHKGRSEEIRSPNLIDLLRYAIQQQAVQ